VHTADGYVEEESGGRGFAPLGRVLGEGEHPLRWGAPLGRVGGVRLRLHWLFILYIAAGLIFTLPRHQAGALFVLPLMAALLVLVLAHEFGHVLAARRVGGEADEAVLWPLGGLAFPRTPNEWRAELWAALGGPLVNAALLPVFGVALALTTGSWRAAAPNLLDLGASVAAVEFAYGSMPWWLVGLWSLHTANVVVLVFNLVPMFPLDMGRVVHAVLWWRWGFHRSQWAAIHVGLVSAAVLVTLGLVLTDANAVLAVGLLGGLVCWMERRRVQFLLGAEPGLDVAPAGMDPGNGPDASAEHAADGGGRDESEEVDRILAKISEVGFERLSGREKRVLKRATDRSRESKGPVGPSDQ
jgi:stage IV sporulation protein FB